MVLVYFQMVFYVLDFVFEINMRIRGPCGFVFEMVVNKK